ncbi:hypothetical protein BD779DRAFT_1562539 [Infundibulicybe gibba]|nr:hypothetical protein BD779DRAFT_1562539 [Infundibulicybe gibba]
MTAFPSNSWVSQSFCFLFLATTVQTSFATYYAWQIIVVSWSKIQVDPRLKDDPFAPFDSFDEATVVLPVIDGIISAAVQIFFSWRIWFLNQTTVGRIFAVLIGIIAVLQFIASLILFKLACLFLVASSWLAGNFIADVLIASSMLYAVSSTGFIKFHHIHTWTIVGWIEI